jgi:hypothetical protein
MSRPIPTYRSRGFTKPVPKALNSFEFRACRNDHYRVRPDGTLVGPTDKLSVEFH